MKKTMVSILSLILIVCCLPASAFVANASAIVPATTIVDNAKSLVDKYPYVWGGESPQEGGFDCSGLVWYVYNKMSGIDISLSQAGRSKSALANAGTKIVGIENFLPGDIIQFEYAHVAIYIGDNTIIEAPGTGQNVKYTTIGPKSQVEYAIRLSSVYNGPVIIGYRYRETFENFKEYPVDHIYYFQGVQEPVFKDNTTHFMASNTVAVIFDAERANVKALYALDETTLTATKDLDRVTIYRLNEKYTMDIILDEKNVPQGKTYTLNEKGIYNVSCNNKCILSLEIVSADYYSVKSNTTAQNVKDNPHLYVPIYSGEEGKVLTKGSALAEPTNSEIVVEEGTWKMDAYNIGGNNYFKLRDLAFAFTYEATMHPFEVTWDSEKNAINIISNKQYTAVGGECGGFDLATNSKDIEYLEKKLPKAAFPTLSEIYVDGALVNLTAYNIDGNNYFKLRDLAQALNFEVNWDSENNMIYVSTYSSYIPE